MARSAFDDPASVFENVIHQRAQLSPRNCPELLGVSNIRSRCSSGRSRAGVYSLKMSFAFIPCSDNAAMIALSATSSLARPFASSRFKIVATRCSVAC